MLLLAIVYTKTLMHLKDTGKRKELQGETQKGKDERKRETDSDRES